jgi:TetR/AcrR family transcriptional regulator, lmrAB and yxaGH operons repressor
VPRPPSDSRERFLTATQQLLQTQGYRGTSLKDIAIKAKAPTGSLYFLFPGGKDEIVLEALRRSGDGVRDILAAVLGAQKTPAAVIEAYVNLVRSLLVGSGYTSGCPIATVALEVTPNNDQIADVISAAFGSWTDAVGTALRNLAVTEKAADDLAALCLAAVEGALVIARSDRNPDIFDRVTAGLLAAVSHWTPSPRLSRRTRKRP